MSNNARNFFLKIQRNLNVLVNTAEALSLVLLMLGLGHLLLDSTKVSLLHLLGAGLAADLASETLHLLGFLQLLELAALLTTNAGELAVIFTLLILTSDLLGEALLLTVVSSLKRSKLLSLIFTTNGISKSLLALHVAIGTASHRLSHLLSLLGILQTLHLLIQTLKFVANFLLVLICFLHHLISFATLNLALFLRIAVVQFLSAAGSVTGSITTLVSLFSCHVK